jgi:hypothetical protein
VSFERLTSRGQLGKRGEMKKERKIVLDKNVS